jgi:hypothetical protein
MSYRSHLKSSLLAVLALMVGLVSTSGSRLRTRSLRDEAGNVITDNLAWIVFGVVAIVVIGGLLETLGRGVVSWVTSQLGV